MILSCSWISLPCLSSSVIIRFLPRLCGLLTFFTTLKLFDVAHSTGVSPLLFRWPRPNHPVALSDVFVCSPTFALKFPISAITILYCDGGFYQDLINGVVEVVCLFI